VLSPLHCANNFAFVLAFVLMEMPASSLYMFFFVSMCGACADAFQLAVLTDQIQIEYSIYHIRIRFQHSNTDIYIAQ